MEDQITRREALDKLVNIITPESTEDKENIQAEPLKNEETSPLQDPTKKYPKPPFKKQFQPFPGLAGKMDPIPDHGEESYIGSGRLVGRKALVTGCLLYTSPSPRDQRGSRMPSSA